MSGCDGSAAADQQMGHANVVQPSAPMTLRVVLGTRKESVPIVCSQPFLATIPYSSVWLGVWKPNGLCCDAACAQDSLLLLCFCLAQDGVTPQPPIGASHAKDGRASALGACVVQASDLHAPLHSCVCSCWGGRGGPPFARVDKGCGWTDELLLHWTCQLTAPSL